MKNILKAISLLVIIAGCSEATKTEAISHRSDYVKFLNTTHRDLASLKKDEVFWKKKIEIEPRGFIFYEKLGSTYNQLFEKTREIEYLHKADSVFAIGEKTSVGKWKVPSLLSLSGLAIKRHDFKSSATYAAMARELTDEKFGPLLMQFDAEMELGNYKMAGAILKKNKRMDSFDYLVRLSKYKDYEGDLDSAIFYMEKASRMIRQHQQERKLWANANLGDMYGHAGRIEDSYNKYLEVLSIDSTYDYALKGIAWVAYSNDGNTADAKEILSKLQQKTAMPDYYMTLAEISEYEGNEQEAEMYINQFLREASKGEYRGMYNKYLIDVLLERGEFATAEKLAREEVERRPTPATYDWLAWTLFKQGKPAEAIKVYMEFVEGKTYEPEVLFHMGLAYHAAGISVGQDYLREVLDAKYELGPLALRKIKSALNG